QAAQGRGGPAVLPVPPHPQVEGLQGKHVPLGILRVIVPARDVTLSKKEVWPLKLAGPDGAVRPGRLQPVAVGHVKRQRRPAVTVVEALDGVRLAVPARVVVPLTRGWVVRRVAVRGVSEDVAGVVGDDVEDDVDPLVVRGLDELAELLARPEM